MMIAVPAFAHRRDGEPSDVVALNRCVLDEPILMSAPMGDVRDVPMHRETDGNAHDHTPDHPRPAAKQIEKNCDGDLMKHPCPLKEAIEWVVANARARIEIGRSVENEPEVQIVESIDEHGLLMSQEPVTVGLPLRPVTNVMKPGGP